MEEGKAHQILQNSWFRCENHLKNKDQWLKVDDDDDCSHENSMVSNGSSVSLSSCDMTDDASSLPSSSSNSSGSLYDLSELMVQLPIKRGLSKFYQGKSESFTSLSRVTSVEDLAKKTTAFRRKMKSSKSCENGLNSYKPYILPKPIISKTKRSDTDKRSSTFIGSRPSLAPLQKKMECLVHAISLESRLSSRARFLEMPQLVHDEVHIGALEREFTHVRNDYTFDSIFHMKLH